MYLIGSLLIALALTVFVVSKIAKMLHAKKPGMEKILLASLIGSFAAFAALVALIALVKDVDPMLLIAISVLAMFIVSTFAFKYFNELSWAGAMTTNIANIALVLITGTAAIVLNGESIAQTIKMVKGTFHANTTIVESIASGDADPMTAINVAREEIETAESSEETYADDEEFSESFQEVDFLPEPLVKKLKDKEKVVYKSPKYQVISLNNIGSAIDKNIRVKNTNGSSIVGALRNIENNDLIIEQRINGGLATIPIAFSKIQKVEVYK